jgi:hypothetical protein
VHDASAPEPRSGRRQLLAYLLVLAIGLVVAGVVFEARRMSAGSPPLTLPVGVTWLPGHHGVRTTCGTLAGLESSPKGSELQALSRLSKAGDKKILSAYNWCSDSNFVQPDGSRGRPDATVILLTP